MDSGWIKLYRKLLDDPLVNKDPDHLAVWIYLLLEATHADIKRDFNGRIITLNPGQLITGRKTIAKQFDISETKVQRILKAFENGQQIEQQTTGRGRLITIINWSKYQVSEQQNEQQVNNKRTTSEQQVNTNKNIRNKECKNVRSIDVDSKRIIDLWNSLDNNISKLTSLSPSTTRYKNLKARLNEHGLDSFEKIANEISNSSFLKGYSSNWSVTFDWVVKPNNYIKVLEGNYRDKPLQNKKKRKMIQDDDSGIETNEYVKSKMKTQSFTPKNN